MTTQALQKSNEIDGFIVIDKPKGPTSHQVDYWIRQILEISKVGHIGTLDPGASGVLVMALGRATKLIDIAHEQPKEYMAVMRLYSDVPEEKVREVFREYETEIYQIPPMRSAVARVLRKRRIHSLEIREVSGRLILFRVECDSGTYIRTLCTDMGYSLGVGAQMAELRRTKTGLFNEKNLVTLQDLRDAVKLREEGNTEKINRMIFSTEYLFRDHAKIIVKKSAILNISRGSDLFPGGIRAVIGNPMRGDRVAVLSEQNELVGTGKMLVNYDEIRDIKVVDFDRVMVENPDQARAARIAQKPMEAPRKVFVPRKKPEHERKPREFREKKGKENRKTEWRGRDTGRKDYGKKRRP